MKKKESICRSSHSHKSNEGWLLLGEVGGWVRKSSEKSSRFKVEFGVDCVRLRVPGTAATYARLSFVRQSNAERGGMRGRRDKPGQVNRGLERSLLVERGRWKKVAEMGEKERVGRCWIKVRLADAMKIEIEIGKVKASESKMDSRSLKAKVRQGKIVVVAGKRSVGWRTRSR